MAEQIQLHGEFIPSASGDSVALMNIWACIGDFAFVEHYHASDHPSSLCIARNVTQDQGNHLIDTLAIVFRNLGHRVTTSTYPGD
ncbi:MAG: hypothetical protein R3C03_08920 [Pirellulaceae bacterium]